MIDDTLIDFSLLTSYFSLLTSHFSLLTSHFLLLTSYFLLLTSYFLLLTSYFLLLTSYFLLLTAHCPLPTRRDRKGVGQNTHARSVQQTNPALTLRARKTNKLTSNLQRPQSHPRKMSAAGRLQFWPADDKTREEPESVCRWP